ncbi:hypothetical protein RUND412_004590 [Rhizina undulata]
MSHPVPPQLPSASIAISPPVQAATHRRARITTGSPTKTHPGGLPRTSPSSLAKPVAALGATEYRGRDDSYTADPSIKDNG